MVYNRFTLQPKTPYSMASRGDNVERNGYQSRKSIIRSLVLAGKKFELAKQEEHWDYFQQEAQKVIPQESINFSPSRFVEDALHDTQQSGLAASSVIQAINAENAEKLKEQQAAREKEYNDERNKLISEIKNLEEKAKTEHPNI